MFVFCSIDVEFKDGLMCRECKIVLSGEMPQKNQLIPAYPRRLLLKAGCFFSWVKTTATSLLLNPKLFRFPGFFQ